METQIGFASVTGLNNGPYGLAPNAGVLYVSAYYISNSITAYNAATGAPVTSGFHRAHGPERALPAWP